MKSNVIIAHHHILSGYGFWAVNDIRGSGSTEIREQKFDELGPIHHGRKALQPSRAELRAFHRAVEKRLRYPVSWFNDAMRGAIGDAVEQAVRQRSYTVWAFASLRNHVHILARVHRDDDVTQWGAFADATRAAIQRFGDVGPDHPVWSLRPYTVFCDTPDRVRSCIRYIENNPLKEDLPRQEWSFVKPYDGWPFHKKRL